MPIEPAANGVRWRCLGAKDARFETVVAGRETPTASEMQAAEACLAQARVSIIAD